jgi:hypothetical protein
MSDLAEHASSTPKPPRMRWCLLRLRRATCWIFVRIAQSASLHLAVFSASDGALTDAEDTRAVIDYMERRLTADYGVGTATVIDSPK